MQSAADSPQDVVEGINAGLLLPDQALPSGIAVTLVKTAIRERQQSERFESKIKKQRVAIGALLRVSLNYARRKKRRTLLSCWAVFSRVPTMRRGLLLLALLRRFDSIVSNNTIRTCRYELPLYKRRYV